MPRLVRGKSHEPKWGKDINGALLPRVFNRSRSVVMEALKPSVVFIMYVHNPELPDTSKTKRLKQRKRVWDIALQLRAHGVDAIIDQYYECERYTPNWYTWGQEQINRADHVALVCTKSLDEIVRNEDQMSENSLGKGIRAELHMIYRMIYDSPEKNRKKFFTITFDRSTEWIPTILRYNCWFDLRKKDSYTGSDIKDIAHFVKGEIRSPSPAFRKKVQPLLHSDDLTKGFPILLYEKRQEKVAGICIPRDNLLVFDALVDKSRKKIVFRGSMPSLVGNNMLDSGNFRYVKGL